MMLEDKILCLLIRQNFTPQHHEQLLILCLSQQVNWESVFETAEQQHVAPLVYINLTKYSVDDLAIPQAVLGKFKTAYIHNVFVKRGTAQILEQVLALFARKGIDVMLVKGEAFNVLVYDQPWYTVSYDVDLVIRARPDEIDPIDHDEIVETLEAFNHQRNKFKEHIEYDYYEHHDVTMNNVLSVDFDRLWDEARKIQIGDHEVLVSPPEDMLIAAAVNSCRKRFFRLKSLCDIATIIEKYPDMDWVKLAHKAREYRCNAILYTALVVTQITLGCTLPEGFLRSLKVNRVRMLAIRRLVSKMSRSHSLAELAARSEGKAFGREFSRSLLLTYATYHIRQLTPKLTEIYQAWRNPPPPVPV